MTEEFICEQCGHTTPVMDEHCPSCGAKMTTGPTAKELSEEEDIEDDKLDFDGSIDRQPGGVESLEALAAEEESENEGYGNQDDY